MTIVPAIVTSLDDWAALVRADLTGAVEGLVAAGRHLIEAKAEHPGTFVAWLESGAVGMGVRTAQRFMEVSRSLDQCVYVDALPPERYALYELARLDPPQLAAAIEAGEVTPDMGRKDAKALVARYRIPAKPNLSIVPPAEDEYVDLPAPTIFPTIVIDPPWQYDNKTTRGAAEDHYPTMTLEALAELDIPADANAHMYLWVTNGFLRQGFDLLNTWDFTYRTCLTWVKPQIGMGNYFRSATEHVLFATRGTLPIAPAQREINWMEADRKAHSAKPEAFYDMVERISPEPWLEMFARRRRFRWHTWGNEA